MACEPFADFGMFVDSVIVEDRVHQFSGRHLRFDGIEEADELLVPVALHAAADDVAIQHVQCSEQGGGAVAPIVMRHVPQRPRLSGRPGCVRSSAWIWLFSSTDIATAWAGDQHRGRIAQLLGKLRIGGQLEMARRVWLRAMGAPDALHRADADTAHLGHSGGGPVRGLTRRISQAWTR